MLRDIKSKISDTLHSLNKNSSMHKVLDDINDALDGKNNGKVTNKERTISFDIAATNTLEE